MDVYGRIWLFSGLLVLVASCNKKEFCDTLDSYGSNVELRYDWASGCCIPQQVELRLTRSSAEVISLQTPAGLARLALLPGSYQVMAYEKPGNIRLEGNIAKLIALPDGTFAEPEDFSAGTCCIDVKEVESCSHTVVMKKQFNRLKLCIEATGKDAALVDGMEGKLSGIAFARDLTGNCCVQTRIARQTAPEPTVSVKFGLEQKGKTYTGSVNYLGVAESSKPMISIRLNYVDGSSQTIEIDAAETVSNPESEAVGESKPDHVVIGLKVEQVKGVFTAKITGWNFETGGNLEAGENMKNIR